MHEAATRLTPGTPCWTSLLVHSLTETKDFYHSLFGWEFVPGPEDLGAYDHALLDGKPVAGIGEVAQDQHLPMAWTSYLTSDDVDESAEMIRACGGTVAVGPLDTETGRLAIAADPSGAVFGVWQGPMLPGSDHHGEPGTPVWHELVTRESGTVVKFYETVFGYESQVAGAAGTDYRTLQLDGRPVASIHGVGDALRPGQGAYWTAHFEVEDVDETARRAVELGGEAVRPPRDAETGRVATVADPGGAAFSIVRTSR